MFFLDFFYGGIVSCTSAEIRWAPMLGVSENPDKIPEHKRRMYATFKSESQTTKEETKDLFMTVLASKVVNPFTPALAPPFIGRRRDFYIPTIPLSPKNVPSVNAHTNVF
jgi:hypothetical protein